MKIITLSREYGAGGHSIGRKVAEQLGIEFYDKDILKETARISGIAPELLAGAEEEIRIRDSFLKAITPMTYTDEKDSLYNIHRAVILSIAKKGPCVILGRCADVILEQEGIESLDVFIYADDVHRAIRVGEMMNSTNASEIQHCMRKHDKARHTYYKYYTGKSWGDCHNYDISLDSGMLGYDTCVKLICEAAKK